MTSDKRDAEKRADGEQRAACRDGLLNAVGGAAHGKEGDRRQLQRSKQARRWQEGIIVLARAIIRDERGRQRVEALREAREQRE